MDINQLVGDQLTSESEKITDQKSNKAAKKVADKAGALTAAVVGGAAYGGIKAGQYALKKFKNWRAEKTKKVNVAV